MFLEDNPQTYDRENIADALVGRSFSAGQAVVRQGDDADGMYFVEVSLVGLRIFCIFYFLAIFAMPNDIQAGTLLVLKKLEGEEEEKTVNEVIFQRASKFKLDSPPPSSPYQKESEVETGFSPPGARGRLLWRIGSCEPRQESRHCRC